MGNTVYVGMGWCSWMPLGYLLGSPPRVQSDGVGHLGGDAADGGADWLRLRRAPVLEMFFAGGALTSWVIIITRLNTYTGRHVHTRAHTHTHTHTYTHTQTTTHTHSAAE